MPTFEGTRMGIRRLGALSGICGEVVTLGDAAGTASALIATGWNASLVNGLQQAGATDQQLTDLLNGVTDPTTILTQLKAGQSSSGGINPVIPPTTPGPAESPAGSTFVYTATYTQPLVSLAPLLLPVNSVIAQMGSAMAPYNLSQLAGKSTADGYTSFGIQLTVRDNIGHAKVDDIKNTLNDLLRGIVGATITGSSLSLVAGPGQSLPSGFGTTDFTSWLQSNWGWLALLLGVVVIGPPLIKKL